MGATNLERRHVLVAAVAAALAGTSNAQAQAAVRLRLYWWGATERAERTNKASATYMQAHPNVTIVGETVGCRDGRPYLV